MKIIQELTENGVSGVHGDLVLCGVTDQTLGIGESHIRRRRSVPLVVSYDLDAVVLPYSDARVGRAEIYSDGGSFSFTGHCAVKISQF
jgi:hypothetical protein